MQDRFDSTLARLLEKQPDGRVLLAVSGGVDSMVMADLFLHSALRPRLAVAHVNFQLRGDDSDGDEILVRDWCAANSVAFHFKRVETSRYAAGRGVSIEMAARELRYSWFGELCRAQGFTHLAVAHNLDDNAETLLLHLLRGTGLRGLCGIRESAPLTGAEGVQVIRPLLSFSRKEIESYAVREGVTFRVDASNADITIPRNRIRHNVFPELAAINPSFLQTFRRAMRHISQGNEILEMVYEGGLFECVRQEGEVLHIDIPSLQDMAAPAWWLWRLLEDFGFNTMQLEQIEAALNAQSGKAFFSATHRLVKDRSELRVYPLPGTGENDLTARLDVRTFVVTPGFNPKQKPEGVLFVDAGLVNLPLAARPPKPGDRFRPFGMHCGSKLLSDYFTDLKLDVEQKRREIVVTTRGDDGDEHIVAIAGRRIDDRFRITAATREVAAISLI